jgi:two-component system chemotaxis response regulator CheB
MGGVTIVQDPATAAFPSMPQSALDSMRVDHCLGLAEIAPLLDRLVREPLAPKVPPPVSTSAHRLLH